MCSSEPCVCIRTNIFLLASINYNNKLTIEVNKNNKKSTNRVANNKKKGTKQVVNNKSKLKESGKNYL